jgi:hypothetical protein
MKVVRFSDLLTGRLYPKRKYFWYSFLLEAEWIPGATVRQEGLRTSSGIEPATFRLVAPPRAPLFLIVTGWNVRPWCAHKWHDVNSKLREVEELVVRFDARKKENGDLIIQLFSYFRKKNRLQSILTVKIKKMKCGQNQSYTPALLSCLRVGSCHRISGRCRLSMRWRGRALGTRQKRHYAVCV